MRKYVRILSIDGGGIRGIIPAILLDAIEKRLQIITKNEKARIVDHFDFIAGTSSGGITCSLLICPDNSGKPKYAARDIMDFYLLHGPNIFKRTFLRKFISLSGILQSKYSSKVLDDLLLHFLGLNRLSEALKPCLITAYEIEKRYAHFFTQHDAKKNPDYDFKLMDVARATSAAPSFFPVSKVYSGNNESFSLVDGAVYANNPTLCAFAEAAQNFKTGDKPLLAKDMVILSLGTGNSEISYTFRKAKNWGTIAWVKPLLDIMMSGVSSTVDYQLHQIFESFDSTSQYLRIEPRLQEKDLRLDNVSDRNLNILMNAGKTSAIESQTSIDKFIHLLINNAQN